MPRIWLAGKQFHPSHTGLRENKDKDLSDSEQFRTVFDWATNQLDNSVLRIQVIARLLQQATVLQALPEDPDYAFYRAAAQGQRHLQAYLCSSSADHLNELSANGDALGLCYLQVGLTAAQSLLSTSDTPQINDIRSGVMTWCAAFDYVDLLNRLLENSEVLSTLIDLPDESDNDDDNAPDPTLETNTLADESPIVILSNAVRNGNALLMIAADAGSTEVVKRLLQESFIRDHASLHHNRALERAQGEGHWEINNLLLQIPAVAEQAKQSSEALLSAASLGDLPTIERFFEGQINAFILETDLVKALKWSALNGHITVLNRLVEHSKFRRVYVTSDWTEPKATTLFQNALRRALWVSLQNEPGFDEIAHLEQFKAFVLSLFERNPLWAVEPRRQRCARK